MRTLGIVAAVIVGGFLGSFLGTAVTMSASQNVGMVASVGGLLAGAVGLGVWVARLLPARQSRLRDRGLDRMGR